MATKSKSTKRTKEVVAVPSRCNFYIADDVRIEQGGKPTLLGFYPDNVIVLMMPKKEKDPTPTSAIGIGGLAILANIVGTKGSYDVELELTGPHGESIMKTTAGKLSGDTENINFVPRFQPMPIIGFGKYSVVMKLNKKPFKTVFEVRRRDADDVVGMSGVFKPMVLQEVKPKSKLKS